MHSRMRDAKKTSHSSHGGADLPHIDVNERGASINGEPQLLNERLFMQLLVFEVPLGSSAADGQNTLIEALKVSGVSSVVYAT